MRERMRRSEVGRQILADRPLITVRELLPAALRSATRDETVAATGSLRGTSFPPPLLQLGRARPHMRLSSAPLRPDAPCALQDDVVGPCWDMPEHTFGGAYARFMGSRGFLASGRPPCRWGASVAGWEGCAGGACVRAGRGRGCHQSGIAVSPTEVALHNCASLFRFIDDPELAYVITRARQVCWPLARAAAAAALHASMAGLSQACALVPTREHQPANSIIASLRRQPCQAQVHDFWHVLFGCHTNGFGEVALKAVEFVQVGGMCSVSELGWLGVLRSQLHCPACRQAEHTRGTPPRTWQLALHVAAYPVTCLAACPPPQTGLPMTGLAVLAGEWRFKPEVRQPSTPCLLWCSAADLPTATYSMCSLFVDQQALLPAAIHPLHCCPRLQDRALLNREFLPWALRAGARAPDLMCIYCELIVHSGVEQDWCGREGTSAVGSRRS